MTKFDNKNTKKSCKKPIAALKRRKQDPESDLESSECSLSEDIGTSDSDSDGDSSDSDFETVTESDSETISDDATEDVSDMSHEEVRKFISKVFPSKYMKDKVKKDKENAKENSKKESKSNSKKNTKKEEKGKSNEKSKNSKNSKKSKNNKKNKYEESSEDDESDYDDDDESQSEDDEKNNKKDRNINIIFGIREDDDYETYSDYENDLDDKDFIEDENEECNSEDEKTFMKETYENVVMPESFKNKEKLENEKLEKEKLEKEKSKSESKNDKKDKKNDKKGKYDKNNKTKDSHNSSTEDEEDGGENIISNFDSEYADLVEIKKFLTEKIANKPNSKSLLKSLQKCKDNIKKLVKKTRSKNTKNYYELISQTRKATNEIDYFKKNLSNKEQLKVMNDLKEINSHIQVDKPYRVALLESQIPIKYKATVLQKLNVLKSICPGDPEYYKIKNWVDTFMRIPFGKYKELTVNLTDGVEKCHDYMENAMKILDDCVYGLNDAKMQILQMIGQWISNPSAMGTAIAIKGPMGTGKTTLVKEGISKILGREFAFIALGGSGDSSFLEGHSYTYEGSSWGKIVQILIDSKCMNPVIYFDELDKISDTPRGEEIVGILTHLTDTSQNNQFHDKYFSEVDFDLSKCLFIFSYNDETKVNPILRDRMYRIQTKGYSTKEKLTISKDYLLPKIRQEVNFKEGDIIIPDDVIEYLVTNNVTKNEDGVRNLKRCLEIIHTKLNLFRLIKPDMNLFNKEIDMKVQFPFKVTKTDVQKLIKNDDAINSRAVLESMYI